MSVQQPLDLQAALIRLESWQSQLPADKQRRFARFTTRGEAQLLPGQASTLKTNIPTVYIRDISRGGVSVVSDHAPDVGSFWQVQIATAQVCLATIPGVVRYSRPVLSGAHLVGIEFGIEASLLIGLGVSPADLARNDESEVADVFAGQCVDAGSVMTETDTDHGYAG